jgi:hypothetical protein
MKIGIQPEEYGKKKIFWEEAQNCLVAASPGAQATYGQTVTEKSHRAFMNKETLLGLPIGRVQTNRDRDFTTIINFADTTLNKWYAQQTEEVRKMFWQKVWLPALQDQTQVIDKLSHARGGAGGKNKLPCQRIVNHYGHDSTRINGVISIHSHSCDMGFAVVEGKKVLSTTHIVKHAHKTYLQKRFQFNTAISMEAVFGVRMGFDFERNMATVEGYSRTQDPLRNEMAKKYLKERNLPVTNVSMEYARKNTRPPKGDKYVPPEPEQKVEGQAKPVVVHGVWETMLATLSVYRAAWEARKGGVATEFTVNDPLAFIAQLKKTPLLECHEAAHRAIKETRCTSLHHALQVGEEAFKEARRPKVNLLPGSTLVVTSEKHKEELTHLCKVKGWNIKVEDQEQKQEQKQEQERKQ